MRNYLYNLATDKSRGFVPAIIKVFLFFLSLIYGLGIRTLLLFYRFKPYRCACKVISVGNITLGGTGKTSLVEFIARYLKEEGHKITILTRGYKKKVHSSCLAGRRAQFTVHSYEIMGDEPCMLAKNLGNIPVIVDKDRIRGARQALKNYNADTVILDDGFQQWKIKKDLEIVTIDSTDPFGNRHMLPRGILREPLSSLKRADVFVLTKTNLNPDNQDLKGFLSRINPQAAIVESIHQPLGFYHISARDKLLDTGILKAKTVTLISGIGDPDSFENLIESLGINIGLSFRFSDHYEYSEKDLENIVRESQKKNIETIVTTEKDAVRFPSPVTTCYLPAGQAGSLLFLVLRIALKITKDEERFSARLRQLYSL